jgi:hypothetical protein
MSEAKTKQTIFTNAAVITPLNISDKMDKVYAGLHALQLSIADGEAIETSGDKISIAHEPFDPVIEHSEIKEPALQAQIGDVSDEVVVVPVGAWQCKHIWTEEYRGDIFGRNYYEHHIVCVKCFRQEVREHSSEIGGIIYGGGVTGEGFFIELNDCENDCYE